MSELIKIIKDIKDWRPDWDSYFIIMCHLIAKRSTCNRLHVGCIITKDNRIISTGYNGHVPGGPHESIVKNNHEQMTIHAEVNAVTDAAKRGISLENSKAYITHYPCLYCTKVLIAAGIKEIVYDEDYHNDEIAEKLLKTSKVTINKFK